MKIRFTNRLPQHFLLLCLFSLLGYVSAYSQQNISLNKPSKQSSTLGNVEGYSAQYANDGILQTLGGGTIACTEKEQNPWWEVDLGATYSITSIKLHNRTNCCPERLGGFTILVSDQAFTENKGGTTFVANQPAPDGAKSYAGNATGRYVRIFLNGNSYLSIPEIQVLGIPTSTATTSTPKASKFKEVKFYSQNSLTPEAAQQIALQNSWVLATEQEVRDAWTHLNLNVYAFGRMASGRFAVPVQKDQSNFKIGPNIGATGGNQGFFYTLPSSTRTFYYQGNNGYNIELIVDGKVIGTLSPTDRKEFDLKIGDKVTVNIKGKNETENPYGHRPIYISANQDVIQIELQKSYDENKNNTPTQYQNNLRGIDILKFNPINVADGFATDGLIFEKLGNGLFNHHSTQVGNLPIGFEGTKKYTGKGDYKEKTLFGSRALMESWSVGSAGNLTVPVDQSGSSTVTLNNEFSYGEIKTENYSNKDVFITKNERQTAFSIHIPPSEIPTLNSSFISDIMSVNNPQRAEAMVRKYGTHYTNRVNYGGKYQYYIHIDERTMMKSHERGLDLTAGIEAQISPNGGDAGIGVGRDVSISWKDSDERSEFNGSVKAKYWYAGGQGDINSWTPSDEKAIPVSVGDLIPIYDLITPELFRTTKDLTVQANLIRAAVKKKTDLLKTIKKTPPLRMFRYRIKSMDYIFYNDDANTRVKGKLVAEIVTSNNGRNKTIKGQEPIWEKADWSEENIGGLTNRKGIRPNDKATGKDSRPGKWNVVTQEGTYVGSGENTKAVFDPVFIKTTGSITDRDDAFGHDVLTIMGEMGLAQVSEEGENTEFFFLLNNYTGLAEKMQIKVIIEVVPTVGFD